MRSILLAAFLLFASFMLLGVGMVSAAPPPYPATPGLHSVDSHASSNLVWFEISGDRRERPAVPIATSEIALPSGQTSPCYSALQPAVLVGIHGGAFDPIDPGRPA